MNAPHNNPAHDNDDEHADNVVYLPAANDSDGVVLNGELVPDNAREVSAPVVREAYNTHRLVPESARLRMEDGAVQLYRAAGPVTMTGGRFVLRHAVYVGQGAAHVWRRWQERRGGYADKQMQRAYLESDQESARFWAEHAHRQVMDRRAHRARMVESAPVQIAKGLGIGALVVTVVLLVLGVVLAVTSRDAALLLEPLTDVMDAVTWTYWFLAAWGAFLLLGGTAVALAALHRAGRRHGGDVPRWAAPANQSATTTDTDLNESMIMHALRNVGHSALNKRFKEGWGSTITPSWVQPPLPMGRGWEFALRLPSGVPVQEINARKTTLAHNLGRRPEEVWVDVDDNDPMAMKTLVLDPGSLREPVPPNPLVEGGQSDFFTGFPVGIDARWNPVVTPVFERNFVIAGVMGSGKSTLINGLLAGAAMDPVVDIDVFCFAENNDYEWLRPVASTISMGDTLDNIDACMRHFHALREDLNVRGQLLKRHGVNAVTRDVAEKEPLLRPRVVVIDECQSFFRRNSAEERRAVVNLIVRFFSAARKYGIVLVFATPTPSDQSLPRDLVAVTTNLACFAINDKARNNVVLGEKAYERGLSALELKPKTATALNDTGTAITVGYMDRDGLLRGHYLTDTHKSAIVTRATELRGEDTTTVIENAEPPTDPLDDIATVLTKAGERLMRTQEVLQRLAEHNPARYRDWTFATLTKYLADTPAAPYKSHGTMVVSASRVREAITDRDDEGGGGTWGATGEAGSSPQPPP